MTNYADAGVDIDAGNRAVKLMGEAVRSTNTPAVLSELGAFEVCSLPTTGQGSVLVASTDGVGTKVELAARYGGWNGRRDLVNHCVDDILVQGAAVSSSITSPPPNSCRKPWPPSSPVWLKRVATSAVLLGETPKCPGSTPTERLILPAPSLVPCIVTVVAPHGGNRAGRCSDRDGQRESAYQRHSLIRLLDQHAPSSSDDLIEWLLTPHKSYLGPVDELRALGVEPKALAHIGGGFFENIPECPTGSVPRSNPNVDVPAGFRQLVGGVTFPTKNRSGPEHGNWADRGDRCRRRRRCERMATR